MAFQISLDVTVRTILQRTAISFGNTSGFGNDLTFFSVREVDLIVLSALWKNLLIFVNEFFTSRILVDNVDLCDVHWLSNFTVIAVVEHFWHFKQRCLVFITNRRVSFMLNHLIGSSTLSLFQSWQAPLSTIRLINSCFLSPLAQILAETRLSIHDSPFPADDQDTVGTFPAPPDPTGKVYCPLPPPPSHTHTHTHRHTPPHPHSFLPC